VHPRTHDLRHSFAVRALLNAEHTGVGVDQRISLQGGPDGPT
jgi:hypothetical protein